MTWLEWARALVPGPKPSADVLDWVLWERTDWPLCTDPLVIGRQLKEALDSGDAGVIHSL